jgi:large subunit ribosomal protein L24
MKQKFSTKWKASKQPRKQRKYRANAPLHIKKRFLTCNLSKTLRKKYGKRNVQLRKNDKVKIMRGKFKGKQGKVTGVKLKTSKITVEGIQVKKLDGSKTDLRLQPSNLQIVELYLDDSKRAKKLGAKPVEKRVEKKKEEKPKELKKDIKKEEKKTEKPNTQETKQKPKEESKTQEDKSKPKEEKK